MAISWNDNIKYVSGKSNFERDLYENLEDMKSVSSRSMPDMFIATCRRNAVQVWDGFSECGLGYYRVYKDNTYVTDQISFNTKRRL